MHGGELCTLFRRVVVDQRGVRHADLPDDLGPQVQGVARVLPVGDPQRGPAPGSVGVPFVIVTLPL